ncbi:extracellular solute-binding protein [Nonomuraea sp. KC401]|uniref:ABC transporter substrate-binding protein n=1 Tax=unclassified Nonomuraea TaxID=2593643 RepID=UPI0010FD24CA|nr:MULTISPECIES: extracellular solute-binding protein [unclassified Nonomuraea]NBE96806.1 extracellular solute-binding protein [Nonomuraea sp. K271]TLF68007.1 extracellular solute-binding protein [Nonomuraea sp. KC401]
MHIPPLKILAAAAACLLAAACTGGVSPSSDDNDSKSLKYLIEEPEDAEALKALKEDIAGFEKKSGIDVKVTTLPFDNMRTVLQTQLRSGEGPDVFSWGSGPSFGGALVKAGLVQDLTAAYDKYGWKTFDFAKERVTYDGKVYGIPGELETIGLFYNKKIFADLGLAQPRNLDDLKKAAEKIRAAGKVPMAVGDKEAWEGGHLLSMALSSTIGGDGMEALFSGKKSWDSPEVTAALQLWADFNKAGYLPKSPTSVDYDTSTAMFFSGEAAMIPTGSWLVGEIDDQAKFEVGYIPFPAPDGPGIFTGGLGSGPWISATASNKEAAEKFLNFLQSEEHGRWTVENLHTIPPRPMDTADIDVSPLLTQVLKDTAKVGAGGDFGHNIDVMVSDTLSEAMYDGVQAVLTGQQSAEEVAASLKAAAEQ